jgi:orotate phosphoribosyltransferase
MSPHGADREALARRLIDRCGLHGTFTLRSGVTSETYFDKYRFEADPALLGAVAEHMATMLPAGTEVLAGLELGGVPLATAISLATGLPAAFVRKQAKTYGTGRLAEGVDLGGRQVTIIEDVVTRAGQIIESAGELRAIGAVITDAVCAVDREQGGRAALAEHGVALHALFTFDELGATTP